MAYREKKSDVPLLLRRLSPRNARRVGTLFLALLALGVLLLLSGAKVARQPPGFVGVVRNGGPFDDRQIRQILQPGQRVTWIGWFSQDPHNYPARHVTRIVDVGTREGRVERNPDFVSVPSRDGVQLGVRGAIYLNFIGEERPDLLERFDLTLGTRRFETEDGRMLYPWQGDDGFAAMLDRVFRPVLANDLRREVGRYQCWQLVASCALVRRTEGPIEVSNPNDAIAIIQEHIQDALERDVRRTFAVPYFVNIRFRINEVSLPERVQQAVDDAQAEFAAVSGTRAEVAQARYQRKRNALLADVYERSPELARIDAIKAAPRGATVIVNSADGRSGSPPVLVGGAGAAPATGDTAPAAPGG